ncbi:MAG: hypothetical protein A9183_03085 [Dehalococcoides mccartyi]|uniref:hypothetical protein n=1 Tax=Dehalococcoides mccartyi TaxID=61435 RepID=UPI000805CF89|nr:hypothetical protein [Dehalococcoides mccartyi]OBW61103.1 MAG: hypothetical protein A9183_03085 [Dehalococcoides mccartyi]
MTDQNRNYDVVDMLVNLQRQDTQLLSNAPIDLYLYKQITELGVVILDSVAATPSGPTYVWGPGGDTIKWSAFTWA